MACGELIQPPHPRSRARGPAPRRFRFAKAAFCADAENITFVIPYYWSDKSSPKKMVKIRGRLHDKKQSIMHFCPQVGLCKADAPCFSGVRGRLNKHHRKNDISLQVGKMPPILQKKVELTIEFHCYTSQITIFRGLTMLSTTHPPLLPNQ